MKKNRRRAVELTSLLDLLFVMIFVSMLQTKTPPPPPPVSEQKTEAAPVKESPAPATPKKISVTAIFHFYGTPRNPQVPSGTFLMSGSFNHATGHLQLGGVSWIKRPAGYDLIPLAGKIDADGRIFTGRVDHPGCERFILKRTTQLPGSKISGKWEGQYQCGQGESGLTLTIE